MNKKQFITMILTVYLMSITSIVLAQSELAKIISKQENFRLQGIDDFDHIVAACKKDMESNQCLNQKEKDLCLSISKANDAAEHSYKNFMDACAYRKLADSTILMPNVYNQLFAEFLIKHKALSLITSKNPTDVAKLAAYKKLCIKEITIKLKPYFLKECMKETPFDKSYRQKLFITFRDSAK